MKEEDIKLEECFSQHGPSWATISLQMRNRSADRMSRRDSPFLYQLTESELRVLQALETLP